MSIFGRSKKNEKETRSQRDASALPAAPNSIVSGGTKTIGDIISNDQMQIDGAIEGTLKVKNHVVVGKGGRVKANLAVNSLQVFGKVVGDVISAGKVTIEETGTIEGNITAPKLVISEGAVFRGNIDMSKDRPASGENDKLKVDGKLKVQDAVSDA